MGDDPSRIGLQHPAFAVSKRVLLDWVNEFFELNFTKVEECATGAVYCQILDCIYPGSISMSKINWGAKSEYEYVNNFKIVQNVMGKKGITKPVPIDRLIKAKYQDNLEFLQWFKHLFECRYGGQEYKAKDRRGAKNNKVGSGGVKKTVPKSSDSTTTKTAAPRAASGRPTSARPTAKAATSTAKSKSNEELKELESSVASLQATVEGLEKERDFYFNKLREVEVMCQEEGAEITKQEVLDILYKTDDAAEGDEAAPTEAAAGDEEETF